MTQSKAVPLGTPRAPDFFLVGAPKCATSSLHALLIKHPDIFMCSPKEPFFFSTDLPGLGELVDRAEYDALFASADPGAYLGEGSAFYLMSNEAPKNIHAANPNARIIISLRNPADAARSMFHQMRDGFREDQEEFETAWNLQEARAKGHQLPTYCPEPRQLQYREIYSYADQVARYLDRFGPDQILILRFEDISNHPQKVVERVLEFLGLPPFEVPVELPRRNTRREVRFPRIAHVISAPPAILRPLVGPVKRTLNAIGIKPSVVMMKHLSRPASKKPKSSMPEDRAFRERLVAAFSNDVARLEELIGEDLSAWRQ